MAKIFVSYKYLKKIGLKYGDPVNVIAGNGTVVIYRAQGESKKHVGKKGVSIRIPAHKVRVLSRRVSGDSVVVRYEIIRMEIIREESSLYKGVFEEVMSKGKVPDKFLKAHILEKHALHGYEFRVMQDGKTQYVAGKHPDGKWVLLKDDDIIACQSWWKQEVS